MEKLRIGILTSQNCEDGQALLKEIEEKRLEAEVAVIISDKKSFNLNPPEIGRMCRERGIPLYFLTPIWKTREEYDREFIFVLEKYRVALVLLIGYMRILTPVFIERYRGRIMNIHPSLLPAFAGGIDRVVHQAVLDSGVKITGCTLHFVTEDLDAGPIILQKAVSIKENETVESLRQKVQAAEQKIIIRAVKLFGEGRLKIEGQKVKILPKSR